MAPPLDMRTVLVAYVLVSLICLAVVVSLWRQNRHLYPGTGFWVADFVMQTVGLGLVAARGAVPDLVSMVVGNALAVAGTLLLLVGLERFLGVRRRHALNIVLVVAFTIVHTYFAVVSPDLTARNVNASVALLIIFVQIAWLAYRKADPDVRPVARGVGAVFVAYTLFDAARIVGDLLGERVQDLFRSGVVDTATLLIYMSLYIGLTVSLALMVNRRLTDDLMADIEQRRGAEDALRASEEKYSLAFRGVPDAIILTRMADGRIIEANERFYEMTGYTPDEVHEQSTVALGLWADLGERERVVRGLIARGGSTDDEATFRTKGGDLIDGLVSAQEISIAGERCILTVIHDLTERKRAQDQIVRLNAELELRVQERTEELCASNEELQSLNDQLAAANAELAETNIELQVATRAKSDFLANMSHELRTPLNSIIGFAGVLMNGLAGPLTDEQRHQLGMIDNSGRHLLELINGVLDLAKIESGRVETHLGPFDVAELALQVLETVRPLGDAKSVRTEFVCATSPLVVVSDHLRVGQILLNLLGNAMKFTEDGWVRITVTREEDAVRIQVADSGTGIPAEELPHVFDDFYQVTPEDGGKTAGTGLGLAVSRRLAESIGARIEVESEPGAGAAFTLVMPVGPAVGASARTAS